MSKVNNLTIEFAVELFDTIDWRDTIPSEIEEVIKNHLKAKRVDNTHIEAYLES